MTMLETREAAGPTGAAPSRSWWRWPRSLFLAMGLGVLVSLPSLNVALLLDDLLHRLILTGQLNELGDWGPLSLYDRRRRPAWRAATRAQGRSCARRMAIAVTDARRQSRSAQDGSAGTPHEGA